MSVPGSLCADISLWIKNFSNFFKLRHSKLVFYHLMHLREGDVVRRRKAVSAIEFAEKVAWNITRKRFVASMWRQAVVHVTCCSNFAAFSDLESDSTCFQRKSNFLKQRGLS